MTQCDPTWLFLVFIYAVYCQECVPGLTHLNASSADSWPPCEFKWNLSPSSTLNPNIVIHSDWKKYLQHIDLGYLVINLEWCILPFTDHWSPNFGWICRNAFNVITWTCWCCRSVFKRLGVCRRTTCVLLLATAVTDRKVNHSRQMVCAAKSALGEVSLSPPACVCQWVHACLGRNELMPVTWSAVTGERDPFSQGSLIIFSVWKPICLLTCIVQMWESNSQFEVNTSSQQLHLTPLKPSETSLRSSYSHRDSSGYWKHGEDVCECVHVCVYVTSLMAHSKPFV